MTAREYWNQKAELLPRADLERLQLARLRRLCEWADQRSPFHRRRFAEAGFRSDQLTSLADLRRIPFMTRGGWMDSQARDPLFGDALTVPAEAAVRYHMTSGTTGRQPLRVLDTAADWEWIAEAWCYGLWAAGVRPADVVFFAFNYGAFIGFWGAHYACEKIGSLVLPSGGQATEARLRQILELGATTVCCTPTYALRLAQAARELGLDLPGSRVSKLIVSGEPGGCIPATKRLLETQWGARCFDTAGMTEIGTIMVFECACQPGGLHIIEDQFIEETVHPETGDPVGYGERGERVVTSFGRRSFPLIRYRTGDLVRRVPAAECPCGRTGDLYAGGILGRVDDMKLVRGTNVFPSAVEAIVREYGAIDEFQIVLWRKDGIRDEITVRVEVRPGADAGPLAARLASDLASAHQGLRFGVEVVPDGSLPRFELKARRLLDERG